MSMRPTSIKETQETVPSSNNKENSRSCNHKIAKFHWGCFDAYSMRELKFAWSERKYVASYLSGSLQINEKIMKSQNIGIRMPADTIHIFSIEEVPILIL